MHQETGLTLDITPGQVRELIENLRVGQSNVTEANNLRRDETDFGSFWWYFEGKDAALAKALGLAHRSGQLPPIPGVEGLGFNLRWSFGLRDIDRRVKKPQSSLEYRRAAGQVTRELLVESGFVEAPGLLTTDLPRLEYHEPLSRAVRNEFVLPHRWLPFAAYIYSRVEAVTDPPLSKLQLQPSDGFIIRAYSRPPVEEEVAF